MGRVGTRCDVLTACRLNSRRTLNALEAALTNNSALGYIMYDRCKSFIIVRLPSVLPHLVRFFGIIIITSDCVSREFTKRVSYYRAFPLKSLIRSCTCVAIAN